MLQIIDLRWRAHLIELDYLREGIHLRGPAQTDPLVAWQREAYAMFGQLSEGISDDYLQHVFHVSWSEPEPDAETDLSQATYLATEDPSDATASAVASGSSGAALAAAGRNGRGGATTRRCPRRRRSRREPRWCHERAVERRRRRRPGLLRAARRCARQASEDRAQRPVPVWERQEVQALSRRQLTVGGEQRENVAPTGAPGTMTEASVPRDFTAELETLRSRLDAAKAYLRLAELSARLAELETQLAEPDLWSDPDRARKVSTAYGRVKSDVDLLLGLEGDLAEAEELLNLGQEEGDAGMAEVSGDLAAAVASLEKALDDIELRSLFSGEHDEADAIAEIHAGAGGTDAQDWAEMMLRMYLRWAERRGMEVEIDEVSEGQEAGILSATFIVRGPYAYGLLASERGVHRLVRMSPFDSQHRRQTSFASFEVVPFLEDPGWFA